MRDWESWVRVGEGERGGGRHLFLFQKQASRCTWLGHIIAHCLINYLTYLIKKYVFLARKLSLMNTCCWRTDNEIFIHYGETQSDLEFVSARQHVLISDDLPVIKNISILT